VTEPHILSAQAILADLVAFDTVSVRSNLALIAYVENLLGRLGLVSRRIPSPDGTKASLLCTIGPADRPGIVLSGHTDVVPVDGQDWSVPPFQATERNGRIHGRGTTDMKGFLAVVLAHVPAFIAAKGCVPIHLAFSYDEELGCRGAPDLVSAIAAFDVPPLLAIVGEPTSLRVARAHKGKLARRLTITGRTGHSALPHLAANAVDAAAAIATGLRNLARQQAARPGDPLFEPPFTTVHVGSLHGGGAVNLVPDHAVLEFEIRFMPGHDPAPLLAEIEALIAAERQTLQTSAPDADIVSEELSAYPALDTAADAALTRFVAALAGDEGAPCAVSFGTEAGIYAAAGITTLVCGPGDMARGHKADEWIGTDELAVAGRMMTRLATAIRFPAEEWAP
jgi:acetylornithine deacetylase